MNIWCLSASVLLNLGVAVGYWKQHNWGMVTVFVAYSVSSLGFIIAK